MQTVSREEVERKAEQFLRRTQKIGSGKTKVPANNFRHAVEATTERSLKVLRARGVRIKGS